MFFIKREKRKKLQSKFKFQEQTVSQLKLNMKYKRVGKVL